MRTQNDRSGDPHATALAAAALGLLLGACTTAATVRRKDASYVSGRIITTDGGRMEVVAEGHTLHLPSEDVLEVNHPGTAMFLAGALFTVLGAVDQDPESKGIMGWGGALMLTGLGRSLSSRAAMAAHPPEEASLRRLPRNRTAGWVVGGMFLLDDRAYGPLLGYELRRPNGLWGLRPYIAGLVATARTEDAWAPAVAAGFGGSVGTRLRAVADVGVNNARQIVFPLVGGVGGRDSGWQTTAGLGGEYVSPDGWFARATVGMTYRFAMEPIEEGNPLVFSFTAFSLGVRL